MDYSYHSNTKDSSTGTSDRTSTQQQKATSSGVSGSAVGSTKLVLGALFLAAVTFGLATYFLLHTSQESQFEAAFESLARETADIAENNAENTFGQLQTLATTITSLSLQEQESTGHVHVHDHDIDMMNQTNSSSFSSSSSFPFLSIPHFDLKAQEIADLTGIEMILFVPFVPPEQRALWEDFQSHAGPEWILNDYHYREWDPIGLQLDNLPPHIHNVTMPSSYKEDRRGYIDSDGFMEEILLNRSWSRPSELSAPVAQFGPGLKNTSLLKLDLFSHPVLKKEVVSSLEYDVPVISETEDLDFLLQHIYGNNGTASDSALHRSFTLDQVKADFHPDSKTVGFVVGVVPWTTFFRNLLPANVNGITVTVASDCGRNFTYVVNGGKDDWAKDGDWHDPKYDDMVQSFRFFWKDHPKGKSRHCHFDLHVYPSDEFASLHRSNAPALYAVMVVAIFIFTALIFLVYDKYQQRKQQKVVDERARAQAIVTSLFPEHIGERLMAEQKHNQNDNGNQSTSAELWTTGGGNFNASGGRPQSKPLADLFPEATVMFADLVGFTSWASSREPVAVFTLLETLYYNFDQIARRRKIFKVETIGDCYVATAGLPNPRKDHALAMARFARDCLVTFQQQVKVLEVELGPDTAELQLRTGLHSGPVTAGVLRGERARFQLFGDTVNTTARIESTGMGGRIHVSSEFAAELENCGKSQWLSPRCDSVTAKGKGLLSTFWLQLQNEEGSVSSGKTEETSGMEQEPQPQLTSLAGGIDDKTLRLINWNTDSLGRMLLEIVKRRSAHPQASKKTLSLAEEKVIEKRLRQGNLVVSEVAEVIHLPKYDHQTSSADAKINSDAKLAPEIIDQLREYVTAISMLYPANAFHNFSHASHVAMSVQKLLSRIVTPKIGKEGGSFIEMQKKIHDHTYGIPNDPLTPFACVLSALIHDVDHTGVSNFQLVKEGNPLASHYHNISIAEQRSVDLAWSILMEPRFQTLRSTIYTSQEEMIRFRQLVVNSVMATDIVDKQLKDLRNARWEKAFAKSSISTSRSSCDEGNDEEAVNRKATIVIEHLIQASDVSHTMQHWHVFRRWNEMLFQEMYTAYLAGRGPAKDPSEFWFQGELGFFDFYIIPLAKKLKECGVFGVSSAEYLNYAEGNRQEWEEKGQSIVAEYVARFHEKQKNNNIMITMPPPNTTTTSPAFQTTRMHQDCGIPVVDEQLLVEEFDDEISI